MRKPKPAPIAMTVNTAIKRRVDWSMSWRPTSKQWLEVIVGSDKVADRGVPTIIVWAPVSQMGCLPWAFMKSGTDGFGLYAETDGASKYAELVKLIMRTSITLTYLHNMPVPTGSGPTTRLKRSCQGSLTKSQSRFLDKKTIYSPFELCFGKGQNLDVYVKNSGFGASLRKLYYRIPGFSGWSWGNPVLKTRLQTTFTTQGRIGHPIPTGISLAYNRKPTRNTWNSFQPRTRPTDLWSCNPGFPSAIHAVHSVTSQQRQPAKRTSNRISHP